LKPPPPEDDCPVAFVPKLNPEDDGAEDVALPEAPPKLNPDEGPVFDVFPNEKDIMVQVIEYFFSGCVCVCRK